jgi:predicted phage tail protein
MYPEEEIHLTERETEILGLLEQSLRRGELAQEIRSARRQWPAHLAGLACAAAGAALIVGAFAWLGVAGAAIAVASFGALLLVAAVLLVMDPVRRSLVHGIGWQWYALRQRWSRRRFLR